MSKKIQESLFDFIPKRGRKSKRPQGTFGGKYLKNYNPKFQRPMDSKKALHLVMKSSKATGLRSFKSKNLESRVWEIISRNAEKTGVRIYGYANGGNHLHLLIRTKYRDDYNRFIRTITGLIARLVGGSEKGMPLKKKFWDGRPFTRIVSFAAQEFKTAKTYLLRNTLEAIGWIPYAERHHRLPKELRSWLNPAPS
jgi:REP element-mobilizing transposase RayT